MSTIHTPTIETSVTTLNAWKKLFQGGSSPGRSGCAIRAYKSNANELWVTIVLAGAAAPAEPALPTDETVVEYLIYAGDTLDLGGIGDRKNDVYVRDPNGTNSLNYRAWEYVN